MNIWTRGYRVTRKEWNFREDCTDFIQAYWIYIFTLPYLSSHNNDNNDDGYDDGNDSNNGDDGDGDEDDKWNLPNRIFTWPTVT